MIHLGKLLADEMISSNEFWSYLRILILPAPGIPTKIERRWMKWGFSSQRQRREACWWRGSSWLPHKSAKAIAIPLSVLIGRFGTGSRTQSCSPVMQARMKDSAFSCWATRGLIEGCSVGVLVFPNAGTVGALWERCLGVCGAMSEVAQSLSDLQFLVCPAGQSCEISILLV